MLAYAALFSTLATLATAAFSIATPPSLVQCQPVSLSWTEGTAPFIISAIPEGQISAEPLKWIAESVQSSPYTWLVDLPAGTAVNVKVVDATGQYTFTSGLQIQKGSSDACLNASSSSGAASTDAPATTGAPSTESAAPTSEAPATTDAPATTGAPATTSASVGGAASDSSVASSASGAASSASGAASSATHATVSASSVKPTASGATATPSSGATLNAVAVPAVAVAVAGALLF